MQDNKFDNQFLENLSDSHRDITSTSSMTSSKSLDLTEQTTLPQESVVVVPERRRRYSAQEKLELVRLTYLPGNTVSSVARSYGIAPAMLFKWRSLEKQGALEAVQTGQNTVSAARYEDGISHKMGRRFLRRGTCTFSSSGTAIYGVSLIHNQLGLDALVDCFKN